MRGCALEGSVGSRRIALAGIESRQETGFKKGGGQENGSRQVKKKAEVGGKGGKCEGGHTQLHRLSYTPASHSATRALAGIESLARKFEVEAYELLPCILPV